MARRETESIMSKLRSMSEDGIASLMAEFAGNEKLRKQFGRAGERLMANKQSFDRNLETMLDFVNIPSKRDIRDLKSRLDTLSSQLVNLSIKVDRMLAGKADIGDAASEAPRPKQRPRSKKNPPSTGR